MAEHVRGEPPHRRSGWFGMVIGVGVLLIVLGVWNVIDGLRALVAGDFVVADAERVAALQVAAWGWVRRDQLVVAISLVRRSVKTSVGVR